MKKFIFLLAFLCFQNSAFGQGFFRVLSDIDFSVNDVCNDYDGGYMLTGIGGRGRAGIIYSGLIKTDEKGRKVWSKQFPDRLLNNGLPRITRTSDSLFLITGRSATDSFVLRKLDREGNTLWTKQFPLSYATLKPYKTEYILTGKSQTLSSEVILRLNSNGDTISQKINQSDRIADFAIQKDGLVCASYTDGHNFKINFDGQLVWSQNNPAPANYSSQTPLSSVEQLTDSTFVSHNAYSMYKSNKNGSIIWNKPTFGYSPSPGGIWKYVQSDGFGVVGLNAEEGPAGLAIMKYDKNGNTIWKKSFYGGIGVSFNSARAIIKCPTGGYLIVGYGDFSSYYRPILIKLDEDGLLASNFIEGKIVKDLDKNCQVTAADPPFKYGVVEAKNNSTGESSWGLLDSLSRRYSINVDTGTYSVTAYPLQNRDFWLSCTPSVQKPITIAKKIDSLDFALKPLIDCPALDVQLTTPVLRRCFNSTYSVNYSNKGTLKANNAYMLITLDSLLEFISATKPLASQTGRTLRFNLGNIGVDDYGRFDITTRVRCGDSTRLGQTLCAEARIFPDTICTLSPLWSG